MKKSTIKKYIYCLILSVCFLLICSKNSPLYIMNDWLDANAFFTVGKGMVRGVVPYLDLFEQKGPLLYFLYGIGSLISYNTFFGVFIIEVLLFSVFLYYSFKIIQLFLKDQYVYFLLPIFTMLVVTLAPFTHGGSSEEFCFPFLMISLYHFVAYLKNKKQLLMDRRIVFLVGLLAGCVLFIKFTLLGFWFAWMMCLFFILISHKKWKEAFLDCGIFLLGMIVSAIPWIIYFQMNGGLYDFFDVYFKINATLYPRPFPWYVKLINAIIVGEKALLQHIVLLLFGLTPLIVFKKKDFFFKKKYAPLCLFALFFFLLIGVYIGGTNFHYYPLIIAPFMLFGLIVVGSIAQLFSKKEWDSLTLYGGSIVIGGCCIMLAFSTSQNVPMMSWERKDYAQINFSEVITKKPNATLLNYGFLDGGFYFTSKKIPTVRYFQKLNMIYSFYPENLDEQKRYIREKSIDFVVVRQPTDVPIKFLEKHYKIVLQQKQMYQGKPYMYILYELTK